MEINKILFVHDNHFSDKNDCPKFITTTFHLFLKGFNGKAHLTSPSLDWDRKDSILKIDSVTVRPRHGYGRALDFYCNFLRNSFDAFRDFGRIFRDYEAVVIAGPCCTAPHALFVAKILKMPVIGYLIGDNREIVNHSKEYKGLKKWLALIIARWEWAVMVRIAKKHKTIALGQDLADQLSQFKSNVSLGFTSLVEKNQIVTSKQFPRNETIQLLSVCRLSQEKGIEWVLRALVILFEKGVSVNYIIVGDGLDRERLVSITKALGIESNVQFVGVKQFDEVHFYYQNADVFILPSLSEGVAKVLIEAMAARLPIIATDVGGNTWILDYGKRGYLIKAKNAQAIVDSLMACITDQSGRLNRLNKATAFVSDSCMERMATKIMNLVAIEAARNS